MKATVVSLYPDRALASVFLGHPTHSGRFEHDAPGLSQASSCVHAIENSAGASGEPGSSIDLAGSVPATSEGPTKQHSRPAHKQPRFQTKMFLSKAGAGRTIVYAPGKEILFEQGQRGNAVFYILTGIVKLTVVAKGKETTIGLLGPGNFAGKECIATVRPRRSASATALTNCTIVRIERKEMLRVIQHEKTFAAFFLDYLLARMSQYQEVIVDQLLNSSEKRLARALLSLARFGDRGKPEEVVPQIHQEELAELVGTTRSRISFFMNRFRQLGFIAYKGHSCITIRTAKLARFAVA
jgi:CRP/FNR family cyclic AMP-dependent transcriptional regulator